MSADDPRMLYVRMRTQLAGRQPLTRDVRAWLREALEQWERGIPFERGLGLYAESGQAWRHPVRQMRRANIEGLIVLAADLAGGRTGRVAAEIARALSDNPDRPARLPGISQDFLCRLRKLYPDQYPRSKNPITQILKGESRAMRDGVVQSCGAIEAADRCRDYAQYGNTAHTLAVRRYR